MKDQHKKISGYRELSQEEIDLMNRVKAIASEVGDLVHIIRGLESTDNRWISIGTTDLQTGFMALTRSIAQPTTF